MSTVSLTGNDTIVINNRNLTDFSDGDVADLTFPNDIAKVKTGKNGNSIFAIDETGRQCELKLRVMRGSSDDKFLNNLMVQQLANFAGTVLMIGTFTKKIGDGSGNITSDSYVLGGGVFTKPVSAKMNVEGDTNQSICEYMLKFTNAPRALG